MKQLGLMLLFAQMSFAQISPPTQITKVFVGDHKTVSWEYDLADEANITHFSLKWVDDLTKTFIELKQVPKTARTTGLTAAFTGGMKFTYYGITAVDARVTSSPIESGPSNTIGFERIGRPPRNLLSN